MGDISFEEAINSVVSGLSVAFDTTALALALSIVLMFGMFFINRWETQRLSRIEAQAESALIGRFYVEVENEDPHLVAMRAIGDQLMQNTARPSNETTLQPNQVGISSDIHLDQYVGMD